jgi:ABC-type glutathione transport system ATPase component
MGITARQQRVFDKNQSVDKSMKEAIALQEKNVYANAEKNMTKLKAGKLGRVAKAKRWFKELSGGEKTYLPKKK